MTFYRILKVFLDYLLVTLLYAKAHNREFITRSKYYSKSIKKFMLCLVYIDLK